MKELIRLQKERIITIKKCDKGAGVVIMNFDDYVRACYNHPNSEETHEDGSSHPFYIKVDEIIIETAKTEIRMLIEEGFNNQILSQDEYEAINADNKSPARFYGNPKWHKFQENMEIIPIRPLVSGSDSLTENAGIYVEYYIKDLANKHPSYIQDTPDFLRIIDEINSGPRLGTNTILVSNKI